MGDVALTVPVLRALLEENPELTITLATHHRLVALFQHIPRLKTHPVNTNEKHHGARGIFRLAKELNNPQTPFNAFIDLHNVTRSLLLSSYLKLFHPLLPVYRYKKGRRLKRALTRRRNKKFAPLEHTTTRYLHAFQKLPLKLPEKLTGGIEPASITSSKITRSSSKELHIAIAPLSAHRLKEWPAAKMKSLMKMIHDSHKVCFYLLGGPGEKERLGEWMPPDVKCKNLAGAHNSLEDELKFISQLDLAITMDSANLHIAALLGIPTLSIWGPTHPYAGFKPLHLKKTPCPPQIAGREDLNCRPCSIFGNRPCFRKDHACMEGLNTETVYKHFLQIMAKRR